MEGVDQSIGEKMGRQEHRLKIWTGRRRSSGQESDARYTGWPCKPVFYARTAKHAESDEQADAAW